MRCMIRNCGNVLAVIGWMTASVAIAQDVASEVAPPRQPSLDVPSSQEVPTAFARDELPSCLGELNLSPEQHGQIQTMIRGHEADVALVWKQFSNRYMDAIRTEALLQCAIEDHLTDAQRTQVRDQRRRVAQRPTSLSGTQADAGKVTDGLQIPAEEHPGLIGVALTPEQESAADKVEEAYRSSLRSHNRDIADLHTRLLSLEADKFVEIEKVLTQDQMKKLREIRQIAPPATGQQITRKSRTTRAQ